MSEVPLDQMKQEKSLWPIAAGILLLVFAPAAIAWVMTVLHP